MMMEEGEEEDALWSNRLRLLRAKRKEGEIDGDGNDRHDAQRGITVNYR
jgi:hypothetical protein